MSYRARNSAMARLQQAIGAHRAGNLEAAERMYRPLAAVPATRADALHFLGVLMHQRGRSDVGVTFLRQALSLVPGHADAHNNLGNVHKECGELDAAEASYRRAVAIAPTHPEALGNLAVVLEARGNDEDARIMYDQWRRARPDDLRAHYLGGRFLCTHAQSRDDVETAVAVFRDALTLDAAHGGVLEALGMALYGLGRIDEAAQVYRDWTARDPEHPVPRHMLAACGLDDAPRRADDKYIRHVFDRFAGSFDEQLVGNLAYRAPEALQQAIAALDAGNELDILDAGCGTGLCGPLLRPWARRLTGIDLSPAMIAQATRRDCYDQLHVGELTRHLDEGSRYDLIACADTLVYFGELDTVFAATHRALRQAGVFAFTLEALHDAATPHRLTPSGRYSHTATYVTHALQTAGFDRVRVRPDTLRREAGHGVEGWVVTARRLSTGGS
ncbi:tetratricopeptide repeat protein [Xanthomonas sp. NCPPB 2632]|uniref:tetratricopeptide repeat protein n=1 Tax=Xanthomonas sp. NCPPB 2632 TaxID=3240912 RepID=UPI0035163A3D